MNKKLSFLICILWMCLIFYFSHQPATISDSQSNGTLSILQKLFNNSPVINALLSDADKKDFIIFIVRKSAHMFIYFMLAILCFVHLQSKDSLSIKSYALSLFISFIYATSDEIHQVFIQGRSGQISDVAVDTLGALIGLLFVYLFLKFSAYIKTHIS